jgi:hypothetical protein
MQQVMEHVELSKYKSRRVYQVANKYEDNDPCYDLWPMEFTSYNNAKLWIENNYNPKNYPQMKWVIVCQDVLN